MPRDPEPLKYLFTCIYTDDTVFEQIPADVSTRDPLKSAFYDIDQSRLKAFALYGPVGAPDKDMHVYVVNLLNGTFAIDNVSFRLHEEGEIIGPLALVFWRRHKHTINTQTNEELSHQVVYRFGWKGLGVMRRLRNGHAIEHKQIIERVMEID